MKKYLIVLFLLLTYKLFANNAIHDYQRIFLPVYTMDGHLKFAIRVFKKNEIPSFLLVDPSSLETQVLPIVQLKPRHSTKTNQPGYSAHWKIASTRYYQLLNKNTAAPYVLENQGITHASASIKENILTIDLCPSIKPFEADFFNRLVQLSDESHKPIPITIAISGMWLIEHPDEFQWLISKEKEKKLEITWANHSFSHQYYDDLPYSENFLQLPATNMDAEILLTEKYLLEHDEMPSIFFRFPGLVSNESLIKQLKTYGLIPLSTDAWLAKLHSKHQSITPGGIILVHGNHNEHEGIVHLLPLLNHMSFISIKLAV